MTFIQKQIVFKTQKRNITEHVMSRKVCIQRSVDLAEIICNNLLPLCNRETLVYDLRNVPATFEQIIAVPNFFKGVNLIDLLKYFGNFGRFEVSRVNLSYGSQNWFELSGVSRNRGFEKSGVKLQSLSEVIQRKQDLVQNVGRFVKPSKEMI